MKNGLKARAERTFGLGFLGEEQSTASQRTTLPRHRTILADDYKGDDLAVDFISMPLEQENAIQREIVSEFSGVMALMRFHIPGWISARFSMISTYLARFSFDTGCLYNFQGMSTRSPSSPKHSVTVSPSLGSFLSYIKAGTCITSCP